MRKRAEQLAQTRSRIVAAAADLHADLGPARTTVTEIARRANVDRVTVYKHFPDERELFGACQAHWLAEAPPPDPTRHERLPDPDDRLEAVLRDLYAWYRQRQRMLRNVLRDAQAVPALQELLARQHAARRATVELLLRGRGARGRRRLRVTAALALVLDFRTWDALATAGLDDPEAARLATAMVAAL
jgi:AcrR family transcriptional regulator